MDYRNSVLGRFYFALQERTLLGWLKRARISANQLTILGLILAALVPLGFFGHPWLGFVCLGMSAVADSLDGPLARHNGQQGPWGALWDSTVDRAADFFYLCGFWVLLWMETEHRFAASLLLFSAFLLTVLISYIKARMESLGGICDVGLMGRVPRTIFLLLWAFFIALLPAPQALLLWSGLILFWLLVFFTVYQRLRLAAGTWSENG